MAGVVTPRKALTVFPVAVGEEEGFWTRAAMTATVAELEQGVCAAGREPDEDTFETETIWLKMTAEQQDVLDAAIAAARRAFDETGWSTDAAFRGRCIEQLHEAMKEEMEQLRSIVVHEAGAPVTLSPWMQVDDPISMLTYWAEKAGQ